MYPRAAGRVQESRGREKPQRDSGSNTSRSTTLAPRVSKAAPKTSPSLLRG